METCGERICKALSIRNLKQTDLVERTGIPKSAISQYCSGAFKPKQKRLFQIAKALDVDEAWLMGLDVPMERNSTNYTGEPIQEKSAANCISLENRNIIKIAGRDGSYEERRLTDEQLAALKAILSQMPEASDDL